MGDAHQDNIKPLNIGILTISDSRSLENDTSGAVLQQRAEASGHNITRREICTDDEDMLVNKFIEWCDADDVDVVIATGGTGVTGRDVTPEALERVAEKMIPGFGEIFRFISYKIIGTSTIQSRASAGVRTGTYIFALPGSPGACKDGWDGILKDQLDIRHRPCNFAEILPRLTEVEPPC